MPDGTAEIVRALAAEQARIRCLQRIGRRGLSTAVIEGMLASTAPYVAVIDGDLQHDETLLPLMLATIKAENLDIVIASRHTSGAAIGDWDRRRAMISDVATRLARLVVAADLTDPMSGFFMLTRPAFEQAVRRCRDRASRSCSICLPRPRPPIASRRSLRFGQRLHGESKLDSLVAWEYLMLLIDKLVGRYVPARFVSFAVIGGSASWSTSRRFISA